MGDASFSNINFALDSRGDTISTFKPLRCGADADNVRINIPAVGADDDDDVYIPTAEANENIPITMVTAVAPDDKHFHIATIISDKNLHFSTPGTDANICDPISHVDTTLTSPDQVTKKVIDMVTETVTVVKCVEQEDNDIDIAVTIFSAEVSTDNQDIVHPSNESSSIRPISSIDDRTFDIASSNGISLDRELFYVEGGSDRDNLYIRHQSTESSPISCTDRSYEIGDSSVRDEMKTIFSAEDGSSDIDKLIIPYQHHPSVDDNTAELTSHTSSSMDNSVNHQYDVATSSQRELLTNHNNDGNTISMMPASNLMPPVCSNDEDRGGCSSTPSAVLDTPINKNSNYDDLDLEGDPYLDNHMMYAAEVIITEPRITQVPRST